MEGVVGCQAVLSSGHVFSSVVELQEQLVIDRRVRLVVRSGDSRLMMAQLRRECSWIQRRWKVGLRWWLP